MAAKKIKFAEITPQTLGERAVLVSFHRTEWQPSKRDRRVEEETAERLGITGKARYYKTVVDADTYLARWREIANKAFDYHCKHSLPWQWQGAQILSGAAVMRYAEVMDGYINQANTECEWIIGKLEEAKEKARAAWGSLYRDEDYPSAETLREKFTISYDFSPVPTGGDFRLADINPAMQELMQRKLNEEVQRGIDEVMEVPWQKLNGAIERLVGSLANEKRRFHYTMFTTLSELVSALPALNIGGNPELEKAAKRTTALLKSIHPSLTSPGAKATEAARTVSKELRKDKASRAAVAKDARKVLDSMAGFMGGAK